MLLLNKIANFRGVLPFDEKSSDLLSNIGIALQRLKKVLLCYLVCWAFYHHTKYSTAFLKI